MELNVVQPLATTMSGLLRQAVHDVREVQKRPGYDLAMECWHSYFERTKTCYVCMAGAVMTCSLGAPRELKSYEVFELAGRDQEERLRAIDQMRIGNFGEAHKRLGPASVSTEQARAIFDASTVIQARYDPGAGHAAWEDYEQAATILEAVGL